MDDIKGHLKEGGYVWGLVFLIIIAIVIKIFHWWAIPILLGALFIGNL